MTEAKLSYRRITEKIAGKLDLLEAYLFYCLALCSDCYTAISHIKQDKGISPVEMASAYATISNNGLYTESHTINYIEVVQTGERYEIDKDT